MGKTVWLDLFCSAPGEGLHGLKIDYEGVQTSEEFLLRTVSSLHRHQSVPNKALSKLRAMFDGVEEIGGGPISIKKGLVTRTATDLLEQTIRNVDDHLDPEELLVIAMDEVPIAVSNIASNEGADAANQLLQTLRGLRRHESRLRWIVSGSIGFHHVLRLCGATEGVVNDLVNLPLGPLEETDARELAERLLLGIEREPDEGAVAALVEQSGRIPFLVHALAHRLNDAGRGVVTVDDVEEAFLAFMDDRDESRAVTHLLTRLAPLYGDRANVAEDLLDQVARADSLDLGEVHIPADILDDLIDDHYLIESQGTIRWRHEVLKRIWVHRRRLR